MENESEQIQTTDQNQPVQKQLNINDVVEIAKPLIEIYQKSKFEQQKQLLDFELKALKETSKQNKLLINYIFFLALIILGVSIYLFVEKRDDSAMNLIQFVISLGAVAFGAYHWGKNRERISKPEDENL
jgi:hypothetical protein